MKVEKRKSLVWIFATLFAVFPLTDTDIWWHLACARDWVSTWTPVREPVVNVHQYFQAVVGFIYGVGGAPLLVCFKAILWGVVFALFLRKAKFSTVAFFISVTLLFIFRFQLEMRPIVFSLLFLGIYWNVLPKIFGATNLEFQNWKLAFCAFGLLVIQFVWCKFQGLYILGPLFACAVFIKEGKKCRLKKLIFIATLFGMPFLHKEGLLLFVYPFELLNRLMGLSPSATIFASEIAENRSPVTLLLEGENPLASTLMILASFASLCYSVRNFRDKLPIAATAVLALIAERNFVLLLPLFLLHCNSIFEKVQIALMKVSTRISLALYLFLIFIMGLWCRSLLAYDRSMVAYQRVPVNAAQWMKMHPHEGRLFNDDRAGGYLAFTNPEDSIYIDGRFILKSADFFERYLSYASQPENFIHDADSLKIDRAIFPIRYYARWEKLLQALDANSSWNLVYRDEYYVVVEK